MLELGVAQSWRVVAGMRPATSPRACATPPPCTHPPHLRVLSLDKRGCPATRRAGGEVPTMARVSVRRRVWGAVAPPGGAFGAPGSAPPGARALYRGVWVDEPGCPTA